MALDVVPHPGNQHHAHSVRGAHDVDLVLTHPDRLHDDGVEAGGVQEIHGVAGGAGQPAEVARAWPWSG
jgi:hypothetical protein